MIKKKRLMITLLSVGFVLCATIGITFAYLTVVTDEKENVFTPSDNIHAKLREPNWNQAEGLKLVPGKTVNKDPMIINSGKVSEYTAIRLTFQHVDGTPLSDEDLLRLMNLTEISWNSKWVLFDGIMKKNVQGTVTLINQPLIFYYDSILDPGAVSDPVFSSIYVKDKSKGLKEADLRWLQGIKIADGEMVNDPNGLGEFYIKVEGAAVQTVGFTQAAEAASTLKNLFP